MEVNSFFPWLNVGGFDEQLNFLSFVQCRHYSVSNQVKSNRLILHFATVSMVRSFTLALFGRNVNDSVLETDHCI